MEEPIRRIVIEEFEDRIEVDGEAWARKGIEHYLSGHIYRGSAMETSSSCGNCDGANCDDCVPVWRVFKATMPDRPFLSWTRFEDESKAKAYYESLL